jgi:hypothetical protein
MKTDPSDHHVVRELLIHGVAFILAAIAGAVILWRFYWFFQGATETPREALEAFLGSIFIIGCGGPAVSVPCLWLRGRMR